MEMIPVPVPWLIGLCIVAGILFFFLIGALLGYDRHLRDNQNRNMKWSDLF